jgi:type II secretory pathway pseudopilin PulG
MVRAPSHFPRRVCLWTLLRPRTGALRGRLFARAFSLVEVLVVVSLMTVIVYGLYTMFDQTQKALRANTAQVDVLESGRSALEAITRTLSQAVPGGLSDTATNSRFFPPHLFAHLDYSSPLVQSKLDPTIDRISRSNVLQSCFFLTRATNGYIANGFFVASSSAVNVLTNGPVVQGGFGTLYQFSYATNASVPPQRALSAGQLLLMTNRFERIKNSVLTNAVNMPTANPLIDGVVHFRIRPFDSTMRPYLVSVPPDIMVLPDIIGPTDQLPQRFYFYGQSLPAFLELELGIVDPQVLQKVKAMPGVVAQRTYLQQHIGAVQLFHKMIPLRNAQP